jgi:hypothetical protein
VALNPARVPPGYPESELLDDARARLATYTLPALARLAELSLEGAGDAGRWVDIESPSIGSI